MLRLDESIMVYVAEKPVDMRKAINSLSSMVHDFFKTQATDGSVYVFYNKDRDRVKCLFWQKNGFVLYHKRLERGRFKFGKDNPASYAITHQQLDWLLAGLDFQLMDEFHMLDFTRYF
jgi:transposase